MRWFYIIYQWDLFQIILYSIGFIFVWAVLGLYFGNRTLWKVLNFFLTAVSIWAILKCTILGRNISPNHRVSIRTIQMIVEHPAMIQEMALNAFLFVPLGTCGVYAIPSRIKHRCFWTCTMSCLFSIVIETVQYFGGLGLCETSDVFMNTLGAILGSSAIVIKNTLFCHFISKGK